MAVTGLPEPRKRHAVAMARFAAECRDRMNVLVKDMEGALGPGTGELCLRLGLHSGSITAGVLRGDKARFQLFGDTINMASRMESTGVPNKIQVSPKTASLLRAAGHGKWLTPRENMVNVKGKGQVQTYFCNPYSSATSTTSINSSSSNAENVCNSNGNGKPTLATLPETGTVSESQVEPETDPNGGLRTGNGSDSLTTTTMTLSSTGEGVGIVGAVSQEMHKDSLVKWNVVLFTDLLKKVLAHRMRQQGPAEGDGDDAVIKFQPVDISKWSQSTSKGDVREEVAESVALLPWSETAAAVGGVDNELLDATQVPEDAVAQLGSLITQIAHTYRDNPFHNFDHASHVAMSTKKLLQRITSVHKTWTQQETYIHTFGIASDPLAQFAVVFAALIHDVDHPGVPNGQLVKEETLLAQRYNNKSVAEQNSWDIAWNIFSDSSLSHLHGCLFASEEDLARFRLLVVNCVMATDIFDSELKVMRDNRWELAFSDMAKTDDPDALSRKSTIVLEHVMQASDICHAMQHWSFYQKWNRNLFREQHEAYRAGRAQNSPAEGWYQGELRFFDNYVIPLSKKLHQCQVFGATSQELMENAYENRGEWECKGRQLVTDMEQWVADLTRTSTSLSA